MRFELEDTAGTGFRFTYDTVDDLVDVELTRDGEIRSIAGLTLEQADRWRNGKAVLHRKSGFVEPITASTLMAPDSSADDRAWLERLGIEVQA